MATCGRCGTIMAPAPGTKCPACGTVKDPTAAKAARPQAAAVKAAAPRAAATAEPAPRLPGSVLDLGRPALPGATDRIAIGSTLLIWGGLALVASMAASMASEVLSNILQVPGFLAALAGVLLVGHGLGFAKGVLAVLALFMLVPGLNLLLALGMVALAGAKLKEAGRKIEFPGVKLKP